MSQAKDALSAVMVDSGSRSSSSSRERSIIYFFILAVIEMDFPIRKVRRVERESLGGLRYRSR